MKEYKEIYEELRRMCPNQPHSVISRMANEQYVMEARNSEMRVWKENHKNDKKFCVEVPKETKTVNINITINESPCEDCVCNQILIRMLNGKEYWL